MQGFPGPQGYAGPPGTDVRRYSKLTITHLDFLLLITGHRRTCRSQGPCWITWPTCKLCNSKNLGNDDIPIALDRVHQGTLEQEDNQEDWFVNLFLVLVG